MFFLECSYTTTLILFRRHSIEEINERVKASQFLDTLLDVVTDTPTVQSYLFEYFKMEKIKYFRHLIDTIEETQRRYEETCDGIEKEIRKNTNDKIQKILDEEKILMRKFNDMKNLTISKLEINKNICNDGLKWLENLKFSWFSQEEEEEDVEEEESIQRKFLNGYQNQLKDIKVYSFIKTENEKNYEINEKINPKFIIGSKGQNDGEFCRPWGVCVNGIGQILVADRSNDRIQIFSESGEFMFNFGKTGFENGEFSCPSGIATDRNLRIIVADKNNHRVQIFSPNGLFLDSFGKLGNEPGEFKFPWDVATNLDDEIAVSDPFNSRIQLFDKFGKLLKIFQSKNLKNPRGLAFYPDGKLLVTDFDNHKILLLDSNMNIVMKFSKEGHEEGELFRPQGIAVFDNGSFAVSDCKNYRIQIFNRNGRFEKSFGSKGSSPGEFDCPQGIAIHKNGNIIVVDFGNNRLQIF
ncbi:conserved hypothetical protein [Pediculus humanus corporis]|uniref:Nhl repeat-containing protein n=1 Tax=Pediculus humanus subsp. corporis TaxID=121224 RepID=E0VCB7_PEDHC|nr:uncharacterized protein Phum_PHUM082960 [Pediculus humanus corporis]EEB11003.1 conserved hypothetical protein [Pediculus humanus corporis]